MDARSTFEAKLPSRHKTADFARLPRGTGLVSGRKIAGGADAGSDDAEGRSRLSQTGRSLAENSGHTGLNFGRAIIGCANDLITTELATRATEWKPRAADRLGATGNYAQTAALARGGATMHPGGARETHCYADY